MNLYYSQFIEKIETGLKTTYLFTGKEEYLMKEAVEKIKERYLNPTFDAINFQKLNGKEIGLMEVINSGETLPFMSEKKLTLVKNVYDFIKNLNNKEVDKLIEYLEQLGDYNIFLFLDEENNIKSNMKIYKYFKKNNQLVDFSRLEGQHLYLWIDDKVREKDKNINRANINYFISKSSYGSRNIDVNLFELENELNKVIEFSNKKNITKSDIDNALIESIDTNIFELLNALTDFNTNLALKKLNDIYNMNEPILRIHYMITRKFRHIISYKLYFNKGYSQSMIQKKLKVRDFEFNKIKKESTRYSIDKLKLIMNELLKTDIKLKTTSANDKMIMEVLIVKISNI